MNQSTMLSNLMDQIWNLFLQMIPIRQIHSIADQIPTFWKYADGSSKSPMLFGLARLNVAAQAILKYVFQTINQIPNIVFRIIELSTSHLMLRNIWLSNLSLRCWFFRFTVTRFYCKCNLFGFLIHLLLVDDGIYCSQ